MMTGFAIHKRQEHSLSREARLSPNHPPVWCEQGRESTILHALHSAREVFEPHNEPVQTIR